jgi:hypothetical protein
MKRGFIWKALLKFRSVRVNQNILIFGFFFLVSAVFWFFNALNKEYYTELIVPVRFVNVPENKLQTGKSQDFIKVRVSAFGYNVIDYKASLINPILIDIKQRNLQALSGRKNKVFFLLTSSLKDEILSTLGDEFTINRISPDTLFVEMVKVVSKRIPVRQKFEIAFRKQFMLKDSVIFNPDSVKIKGLESILDTIKVAYTKNDFFGDVHDSLKFEIELTEIEGTEISPEKVNCIVPAEEFTELEFKIPIEVLNIPVGYSVKVFPSEAKIVFNVGFSKYAEIYGEQFRLVVDYKEIEKHTNSRLIIKLDKMPGHISNIRIYPQSVDYIIEKND